MWFKIAVIAILIGGFAMPRGQPDFGLYTETPVASGISDPGEAAARLGGINVYDRRGWTVWMDDFEAPVLKWVGTSGVGGTLPALSTTRAWMGIQSMYFVTAAAANVWAEAMGYFPLVRQGKVGFEFWIYLNTFTPNYFRVVFYVLDGTNVSQAEIRLDSQARTATIRTPAGYIIVATESFNTAGVNVFTPVKLVVDTDTDRYVRLLIGQDEIDLSAHSLRNGGPTINRLLQVQMVLMSSVAGVGSAYIDNFILTQNEP